MAQLTWKYNYDSVIPEINQLTAIFNSITEQMSMLALNAAIEATRAKETAASEQAAAIAEAHAQSMFAITNKTQKMVHLAREILAQLSNV